MQNPFTLTFGKSPLEPVERPVQTKEIIDTFTAEQINQQMFAAGIITYGIVALLEFRRVKKVPMDEALKNVE